MKNSKLKLFIIFSVAIIIFSFGIVGKTFQNDTFFNIAIGKYISENGIDMMDHFSWVPDNLEYGYSHWAFDILTYFLYSHFGFKGIYFFIILFTALTGITLFYCLSKRSNSPVISFFITLFTLYLLQQAFAARSQIISFLCFIVEIYAIENFIETNKKRYAIILAILSIIIANFHAATWPLFLILFMPYIASALLNKFTYKYFQKRSLENYKKKIVKLKNSNSESAKAEIQKYENEIEKLQTLVDAPPNPYANYKIQRKNNYNLKNLLIVLVLISFTALLTPIKDTPYTYILKSMFGKSNFESTKSIAYVAEMQPTVFLKSLELTVFTIFLLTFLIFTPSKLNLEHGFLLIGLYLMSLTSYRYIYLLVFLGSYVLCDLIVKATNLLIPEDIVSLEKLFTKKTIYISLLTFILIISLDSYLSIKKKDFVDETLYPTEATNYILENLDYKNIKIYNAYDYGSYLMLNNIPVFLDSRLDVYCSEFNKTNIFYDYVKLLINEIHYEDFFGRYDFSHILLKNDDNVKKYLDRDNNYKTIYEDEYFTLYER